jgi:hypothetical protein
VTPTGVLVLFAFTGKIKVKDFGHILAYSGEKLKSPCSTWSNVGITDDIISRLKSHQIGKSPDQIAEELKKHQLHMKNVRKRKAEKLYRDIKKQRRKIRIQNMRTTLRQMEKVVDKQQSMMDCNRAILQRQVELLQFTIAEVKRQSALTPRTKILASL